MSDPTHPKFPPHLVLLLGIFAVASSSLLIRYAQQEVGSLVIAAYRMALSALILIPLTLPRHTGELRQLNRRGYALAALSGVLLAVHFASWILSLEYTSVASSVVLVTTNPLWVALLAPLFLKEKLGRGVLLGMLVALAGGVVVALSDSCSVAAGGIQCPPLSEFVAGRAFYGNFLALVGAWSGAGYILIGRSLRPQLSLTAYIFLVYGVAAVVLVALVPFSGQPAFGFAPMTYVYLLLLAVLPQLIGHSSFNWALAHLPASYVSIALLGEPVSSTILAVLLLGEVPGWLKLGGAALILIGILIATLKPAAQTPDV
ncbi:MAG: DMT family transporter [Anaerolineales bacterium]|nr:DMT family transporter [Anaerolineales bacterium]